MQAVILAGGKGTRLLPLTRDIPKPMILINKKPILEYIFYQLRKQGIRDIIVCVGYKSEVIERYFKNGKKFGVNLTYMKETTPLGTAGAVKNIDRDRLEKDFFLIYGDTIFNINLIDMMEYHIKKEAIATLLIHKTNHPQDSDLIRLDQESRISEIVKAQEKEEKPISSAALYLLNKKIIDYIPFGNADFIKEVFSKILYIKKIYGYYSEEYIKDMGTQERLKRVEQDIKKGILNEPQLRN